ncbi:MAG: ATP-binding cassette domain-containing protein [Ignavibacteriae bacterium]|nr:ATP-binding cassette domain-containing protein [Ignavibacteriota bacterium]
MHIDFRGVSVQFDVIPALSNITAVLPDGQTTLLVGPTGAGKTTLLRLLFADIFPHTGSVFLNGQNTAIMKPHQKRSFLQKTGIVFQDCKLLPHSTVYENVLYPLIINEFPKNEIDHKCLEILLDTGISHLRDKYPHQLSGGEKHLVALSRAIIHKPEFLIADEPTGNLDADSTLEVATVLQNQINKGVTVVISTHSSELIACFPKATRLEMSEGKITKVIPPITKTIS